jgi:hypothetical protein
VLCWSDKVRDEETEELDISAGILCVINAGTPFECALLCALYKRKDDSHHWLAVRSVAYRNRPRQVEVKVKQ